MKTGVKIMIMMLLTLVSCKEDTGEKNKQPQAGEAGETKMQIPEELAGKEEKISDWSNYYETRMPSFRLDHFEARENSPATFLDLGPADNASLSHYKPLLSFNADSSRYIDIFSYNLILEKGKDSTIRARTGDPDMEAAIVDVKTGKRLRIWYCGPSCALEKAVWLEDQKVGLLGLNDENGDGLSQPTIWVINLVNGQTTSYVYPAEINSLDNSEYLSEMLRKKGMIYEY
ncbi:MAG: hypothetical protein EOP49_06180 [Sphingobacteriales bacterium]|nr:MAG: hypothetical protein EOP49_06180 [Sphingobacteriales bacterium]